MLDRSAFIPNPIPSGLEASLVSPPDPRVNRKFYSNVGQPWNWRDRSGWSPEQWLSYVVGDGGHGRGQGGGQGDGADRGALKTWVGRLNGDEIGYFELELRAEGDVEIALFGLLPEFIGRGLGSAFLSQAITCAWAVEGTRRVWVHTCTDDHPHAFGNYQKRGFELFKTEEVERPQSPTNR